MRRLGLGLRLLLTAALIVSVAVPASGSTDVAPLATGSISGRVTAPAGVDVTKVLVSVGGMDLSGEVAHTYVKADGTYTIAALPPGWYYVKFNGWGAGLLLEYWNDRTQLGNATGVDVGSGPVTGIDATLVRGATLSGTIHTNSDCDLGYVKVWAWGPSEHVIPDSRTRPDGTWTISGIPGGTYEIEFDGRSAGLPREFWNPSGVRYRRETVTVTLGETRGGIDITLNGPRGCVPAVWFVDQVYRDLLDRAPEYSGLRYWADALIGGAPRAAVANAITGSDEYRAGLIRATYLRYLERFAEPTGLTHWLGEMRAGAQIEDIQAYFVASNEFWLRNGGTPSGWVTGLYRTVLGREPSGWEVQLWASLMADGASRSDVARGFLYSTEHLTEVVDGYYLDVLGRHIDPSGQVTWVGLIQRGYRDEQIVAGILSSEEYAAKVRRLNPSAP